MVLSIKLKLITPNKAKAKMLSKLTKGSTDCINWWLEKIRKSKTDNIKVLFSEYYSICPKFGLNSEMRSSCLRKAISISRKSINAECKKHFVIIKGRNIEVDGSNIGLGLGGKKTWFPFRSTSLPGGKIKDSLIKSDGRNWYCHLAIDVQEDKIRTFKRTIGVDLGLAKIATLADQKGNGTKFFRGERLRRTRGHYYELRKRLQPKIKQGNVYKLLKRLSKKESNWMRDANHKISREIVGIAKKQKANIAVENLAGIRERIRATKKVRRMLHTWSFNQLQTFLKYKACLAGIVMLAVDPRETSRRCPKCGYVSRSNRKSQSRFKCNKCGYESNADRIGAMNIALKGTELLASQEFTGKR